MLIFWIYCSSHTPQLTDRRDLKAHNPLDRNHHRQLPGKQKEIHLQGNFSLQPISLSSTVGSWLFLDMWCTQMFSSFWMVEIGNTLSGKVSFVLNSSSSIFRLARFYSDLERSNCWSFRLWDILCTTLWSIFWPLGSNKYSEVDDLLLFESISSFCKI
jgi:hypothetical protein